MYFNIATEILIKKLGKKGDQMGFESFKEHSVAEFFKKNKQMLGFSGKVRSLTTIVHEYVTNSLDAAEENRILPTITIEIKELEKNERYLVIVEDNAGGIPKKLLGKALGKILAGTKFHRRMQARGQQGIGAAGCTMYSYLTTGKPIKAISCHKNVFVEAEISIDVNKNEPIVNILTETLSDKPGGLKIIGEFADVKYDNSQYGVLEYIKRTAIVNPALEITFLAPDGQKLHFPRASDNLPPKPQEVLPHMLGVTPHDFYETMKNDTDHRSIETAMVDLFARCTKAKTTEIQELVPNISLGKKPTDITWEEANQIVTAAKKVKWIAPSVDSVIPIGEQQLQKALLSIINPVHYAITQRPPKVFQGGIPFIVECALAYGGNAGKKNGQLGNLSTTGEVMRFANRVPLLFDAGGCAITEAVKTIDWKRYGIKNFDEEPITLIVNLSSVFVPYTGAGKQSIAPEEEIVDEIRFAIMETARNLQRYLSGQKREAEIASKKKALLRYVEQLATDLAELSEQATKEELEKTLAELVETRYLNKDIDDESEPPEENLEVVDKNGSNYQEDEE